MYCSTMGASELVLVPQQLVQCLRGDWGSVASWHMEITRAGLLSFLVPPNTCTQCEQFCSCAEYSQLKLSL